MDNATLVGRCARVTTRIGGGFRPDCVLGCCPGGMQCLFKAGTIGDADWARMVRGDAPFPEAGCVTAPTTDSAGDFYQYCGKCWERFWAENKRPFATPLAQGARERALREASLQTGGSAPGTAQSSGLDRSGEVRGRPEELLHGVDGRSVEVPTGVRRLQERGPDAVDVPGE